MDIIIEIASRFGWWEILPIRRFSIEDVSIIAELIFWYSW